MQLSPTPFLLPAAPATAPAPAPQQQQQPHKHQQHPQQLSMSAAARKLAQLLARCTTADRAAPTGCSYDEAVLAVRACTSAELAALDLAPPHPSTLGPSVRDLTLPERLRAVQAVISSLQYNYTPGYAYDVDKKRTLPAILQTAAQMLVHPLPIKCIEAVFLGLLLTHGWPGLQRLPLGFKSRGADGAIHRHIVLAVCQPPPAAAAAAGAAGACGALGISRCPGLMDKPLQPGCSLSALVADFAANYARAGHQLLRVRVGLPVESDASWTGPVCWRHCSISPHKQPWQDVAAALDVHAAAAADLQARFRDAVAAAAVTGTPRTPRGSSSMSRGGSPSSCLSPRRAPVVAALLAPRSSRGLTQTPGKAAPTPCAARDGGNSGGDDESDSSCDMVMGGRAEAKR